MDIATHNGGLSPPRLTKVYVVVTTWSPDRYREQFCPIDRDIHEIIGTFATLTLANEAAEAYVQRSLEQVKRQQKECSWDKNTTILVRRNKHWRFGDGTMKWTVYAPYQYCRTTVETFEQVLPDRIWDEADTPYPPHPFVPPQPCNYCEDECAEHTEEAIASSPGDQSEADE